MTTAGCFKIKRRRKVPEKTDSDQLDYANKRAAKAINDIVKVVEDSTTLTMEEVQQTFQNLAHILTIAQQKAILSLPLALAVNGAVKLGEVALPSIPGTAALSYPPGVRAPQPERIAGERTRTPPPDDDDGVDFE